MPFFRRYRRRRPRRFRRRYIRRAFRRYSRRRRVNPSGHWLKGRWNVRTFGADGDLLAGLTNAAQGVGLFGNDLIPVADTNAIDKYDTRRRSTRVKIRALKFSVNLHWTANATRFRLIMVLGRTNLTNADHQQFWLCPGVKQYGNPFAFEQGGPVGLQFRQNYMRPFYKKIYFDKQFRRPASADATFDTRVTINLRRLRGLNIQFGYRTDDFQVPQNQELYLIALTDEGVAATSAVRNPWWTVKWTDGKPLVPLPHWDTPPGAEAAAPTETALGLTANLFSGGRVYPVIDHEDEDQIAPDQEAVEEAVSALA